MTTETTWSPTRTESDIEDGIEPDLKDWIFQAVGSASTCWGTLEGAGIFDSDRAKEIGDALEAEVKRRLAVKDELLYDAWNILANVSEGDWSQQPQEWQDAVARFRDAFHAQLSAPQQESPA